MTIDVSDVLIDPDLADTFTVTRRQETVNPANGRSQITGTTTYANTLGVVCAAHPNDLERVPEGERMTRHISIVTTFRLQGPTPGYQPDLITWKGDTYIVKTVDPYPQYGAGFVQVIAGSIDMQNAPVP